MRLLDDLRFIIGLLFAILGVLLLLARPAFLAPVPGAVNANVVGGVAMTAFAALMLALAVLGARKSDG
ncbi:MAG TPA: hypothetical protein VEQ10_00360 [Vicinamibacteria bacterium]|nr:hypothetical protein [Vicinamibacteria bacterium]